LTNKHIKNGMLLSIVQKIASVLTKFRLSKWLLMATSKGHTRTIYA